MVEYDLELQKAVDAVIKADAKLVLVQLPDGLKPQAEDIQRLIESKTKAKVVTWMGSCYGACDIPTGLDRLGFDLVIHWGHSEWRF